MDISPVGYSFSGVSRISVSQNYVFDAAHISLGCLNTFYICSGFQCDVKTIKMKISPVLAQV